MPDGIRDLRGLDLKKVQPPPTEAELDYMQRAERFFDEEFVDEVMTPAEVKEAELEVADAEPD